MPEVSRVLPSPGSCDPAQVVADLREAQLALTPFDDRLLAFASELSRRLRRHPEVRRVPALGALAYWIRPSNLGHLADAWMALDTNDQLVRAPRGVIFHIPPANVDTLFVYSWLLAALAGNANIIRLAPAAVHAGGPMLNVLAESLAGHPVVAATTALVSYDHEDIITAALSQVDGRVVWGGDDTVAAIRALPLAPNAIEVAFADRFSLALLDSAAVTELDATGRAALAQRFFNDAYWFDQLGCASPRLVIWRGNAKDSGTAAQIFRESLVTELTRRRHSTTPSVVLAKLVHVAEAAARGAVDHVRWANSNMTVASLTDLASLQRDGPGGGLFYEARIDDLEQLIDHTQRRDQTLTHFGVSSSELVALARGLGARGIDRIVPIGQALTFGRFWDGHDLLRTFSRTIVIETDPTESR